MRDIIIVIVGLILLGAVWITWGQFRMTPTLSENGTPRPVRPLPEEKNSVVCTADAKLCSDGSYVGRAGPNCEFAACPEGEMP